MGMRTGAGDRTAKVLFVLLAVLFVQGRWIALHLEGGASDVPLYARYAWEYGEAARLGVSFYEHHARAVQDEIDAARAAGKPPPSEEYKVVEYPPLAVALWQLPTLWMRQPDPGGDAAGNFAKEYVPAYRLGMAAVDAVLLGLMAGLVWRLFAAESVQERLGRLLAFVLFTLALLPFHYERLDLLQAALVVGAFALLVSPLPYGWSFAVLALAVHLKLVPLVLAPVWVVGSLPTAAARAPFGPGGRAALAARAAVFLALVVGGFLFFRATAGPHYLDFLEYHQSRGIEVESFWGCLLLALRPLGQAVEVYFSHCSLNLRSPLSQTLAAASGGVFVALGLAATFGLLAHARRLSDRPGDATQPGAMLAQRHPRTFACYALLFLMAFIAANKVFSPQYLLWLAPFAVLVPFRGAGRLLFQGAFFLACLMSSALLVLLATDVVKPGAEFYSWTIRELTDRLVVLLLARNLLFLGLAAAVVAHLIGSARRLGAPPAERKSPGGTGTAADQPTTPLLEAAK